MKLAIISLLFFSSCVNAKKSVIQQNYVKSLALVKYDFNSKLLISSGESFNNPHLNIKIEELTKVNQRMSISGYSSFDGMNKAEVNIILCRKMQKNKLEFSLTKTSFYSDSNGHFNFSIPLKDTLFEKCFLLYHKDINTLTMITVHR